MYRPDSPLPKAAAPDRQAVETKAAPHTPKVTRKYMNFAEALQALIERAEVRRHVGENSATNLPH
jgi:hypothetical protein